MNADERIGHIRGAVFSAVLIAVAIGGAMLAERCGRPSPVVIARAPAEFIASRINDRLHGGVTKSGEVYDSRAYVCAVKASLGFVWGDIVVAQSIEDAGDRLTVARVVDLLPASAPSDIDFSGPAFRALAPDGRGHVRVFLRKP